MTGAKDDKGTELTEEQMTSLLGEIVYEFKSEGVLVLSMAGQNVEGTWSQDGNKVTFEFAGEKVTADLDGDKMSIENSGYTMELEKQ